MKRIPLLALLLIASFLGGSQCAGLCSFLAIQEEQQEQHEQQGCHHQSKPEDTRSDADCDHPDIVAGKLTADETNDGMHPLAFLPVSNVAAIEPFHVTTWLGTANLRAPRSHPLMLTSILRI